MIDKLASAYLADPHVAGVFLTGSRASGRSDDQSDYDLVVVTTGAVHPHLRERIARDQDPDVLDLAPGHFGDGDAWIKDGVSYDIMFWDLTWLTETLTSVIHGHHASEGYTTAHWFTVASWIELAVNEAYRARLNELAELASTTYPEELKNQIIRHNYTLLRPVVFSYEHQLATAVSRGDTIAVNHRIAAIIASWTDIVFAEHRLRHPGEKKLFEHLARIESLPENYAADLHALASGDADKAGVLIDRLTAWLEDRGSLPQS